MKNAIILVLAFILISILTSGVNTDNAPTSNEKGLAEVNRVEGYYIFTDSKPVQDYEYLGTIKGGVTFTSGQYEPVRNVLIRKAKKRYPKADGLILHLKDGGTDRADAIYFKD